VAETGIVVPPTRVSRVARDTPTPVFLEKRLQAVENKGQELQNNGKEAAGD
jgi:hypothetical protein